MRHNFQGSYDSLNFNEKYWDLRQENLFPAETLGDVYRLTNLTENQHAGHMRQNQYSSIMDYGYSWQNDLAGLGKYDRAAVIFGYTSGAYEVAGQLCSNYPSSANGQGCIAQLPGLIEVFSKRKSSSGGVNCSLKVRVVSLTTILDCRLFPPLNDIITRPSSELSISFRHAR